MARTKRKVQMLGTIWEVDDRLWVSAPQTTSFPPQAES